MVFRRPLGLVCVLAALLACAAPPGAALHFMVKEGATRCFIEEVPSDVMVLAHYKNPDASGAGDGQAIVVTIKDPTGEVILTQTATDEGRIAFTSHMGGEHLVCLGTVGAWGSREFRFELEIEEGDRATDYEELAKMEHLSAIEVEVRKLTDKVNLIRSEQSYQRQREADFRDTTESTNSRVLWFSLLQTIVLCVAGVVQVLKLKRFFKLKKLA